jgi:tetratricopeptide (TPR) repeat protein
MSKQRYHIILLLLLTVMLPAALSARKKNKQAQETSLLTLDEQHYFDSLYFQAVVQEQCERPDSAVTLMKQAVAFYDSIMTSQGYELNVKLPSEEPKEMKKGIKNPTSKQVPGLAAAYFFLSNRYRQQNNAMNAILSIEQAIAIDSVNYWYTEAEGDLFLALNRVEDARICYERLVRNYPDKSEPLYNMSEIYLRLDSVDECLDMLNKLEEIEGINEQLTRYKFAILSDKKRTEEGFDEYRKLIARYPYNVRYRIQLGDMQMQYGQIPQAKETYEAAAAVEPDNAYVWIAQANYYSMTGDQDAADKLVASALINENLDVDTKVDVMGEYLKGSFRKLTMYREQIAKGNVTSELDTMALFNNVDSLFTAVTVMHPTSDEVYELQAEWRNAMGQDSLASESMRFAVDLKPTSMEYWEQLLYYSTSWMPKPQIIELTQEALQQHASNQTAYLVAAWAYIQEDKNEKAIEQYRLAIDNMSPPDANKVSTLWGNIGDLYYQADSLDDAFECYDKAVKYNPTNYNVLNNYAYYLSQQKKDLTNAENMALKVIQKYPDNPTYLDTYAWILYLEESYTLATFYQQHAIDCLAKDDKGNSTLFDHYGDMLLKSNDLKGAIEQWKKALECDDVEDSEKIQKKIDSAETLLNN